jgi:hypothetical protein
MKELNLYRLWEVCTLLSEKESELAEQDIFVPLLGHRSNYSIESFEGFLNYYYFKLDGDEVIVFNDDGVPYEDYRNDDFSYVPTILLSFSPERIENWMKIEIDLQLERQKREKAQEKENIKLQIERLQKQLNNL